MNNVQLYEMSKKVSKNSKRGKYHVVLHNDNHNTFEHVIDCLTDICGHNEFQAHQCALIVHNSGRCNIFIDSYSQCESVYEYLLKSKLKVTIEKHDSKHS
jgi:ATP-dependent Clp protease adaptor protein ClpS